MGNVYLYSCIYGYIKTYIEQNVVVHALTQTHTLKIRASSMAENRENHTHQKGA